MLFPSTDVVSDDNPANSRSWLFFRGVRNSIVFSAYLFGNSQVAASFFLMLESFHLMVTSPIPFYYVLLQCLSDIQTRIELGFGMTQHSGSSRLGQAAGPKLLKLPPFFPIYIYTTYGACSLERQLSKTIGLYIIACLLQLRVEAVVASNQILILLGTMFLF